MNFRNSEGFKQKCFQNLMSDFISLERDQSWSESPVPIDDSTIIEERESELEIEKDEDVMDKLTDQMRSITIYKDSRENDNMRRRNMEIEQKVGKREQHMRRVKKKEKKSKRIYQGQHNLRHKGDGWESAENSGYRAKRNYQDFTYHQFANQSNHYQIKPIDDWQREQIYMENKDPCYMLSEIVAVLTRINRGRIYGASVLPMTFGTFFQSANDLVMFIDNFIAQSIIVEGQVSQSPKTGMISFEGMIVNRAQTCLINYCKLIKGEKIVLVKWKEYKQ